MEPVHRELLERGYLLSIFHYPLVKFDHAIIRIIPNLRHTEAQLQEFIETLRGIRRKYNF